MAYFRAFCKVDIIREALRKARTTVMLLLRNGKVQAKYKDDLKKKMLYFSNVDVIEPTGIKWSSIRSQRNNQTYRMLVSICQLIIEGMLITTDAGDYVAVEYPPTEEILDEIDRLNAQIAEETATLRALLGK